MDLSSSVENMSEKVQYDTPRRTLTRVIGLVAVLLALMESVVLLLLLNLRVGYGLLVIGLVDLRVSDVGVSAHIEI